MHICTTADLGHGFTAAAFRTTDDRTLCLVTTRASQDKQVRDNAIELLRREGIDCGSCPLACPAGLSRTS